ncbi:MAG: lipopolysaccharide biosynthesis protein [Bacteroidota bacterium]
MALKDKTISGLLWSVSGTGVSQLLTVALTFYLARLLGPEVFGTFAVITLVARYANRAIDAGLGIAIIQRKDLDDGLISSIFWLNTAMAFCLAVLVFFTADAIAGFMEIPASARLLRWLPLILLVNGITITQRALLRRRMDFRTTGIAEVSAVVLGGIVAIVAALHFEDERALFARLLVATSVMSMIYWVSTRWRPNFQFKTAGLKETLAFSLPFLGERTLVYWAIRLDRILIAKRLDENALGLFDTGFKQISMPLDLIHYQLSQVMFAAFSSIQEETARIEAMYSKVLSAATLFGIPVMVLITLGAPELVRWLLGPEWEGMIIILQGLALAFVLDFGVYVAPVLLSRGKSKLQLKVKIYALSFRVLAIIGGLYLGGINGLLIGLILASGIRYLIYANFVAWELEVAFWKHFRLMLPALLINALALGGAVGATILFASSWPHFATLIFKGLVFAGIYLLLMISLRPRGWMVGRQLAVEYHYKLGPLGPLVKRWLG